ncbi:hypothetical protein I4F81_000843 [Pyropia yezoensis]|uniref:Uncharacterized protein n=1 Tax=Pyropia yezoensis TaxID=2788 RepID=A0ACC3BK97_PYRYE|nr:hypothetical protein I4F81_000843 [Neopyropia yezoensis]
MGGAHAPSAVKCRGGAAAATPVAGSSVPPCSGWRPVGVVAAPGEGATPTRLSHPSAHARSRSPGHAGRPLPAAVGSHRTSRTAEEEKAPRGVSTAPRPLPPPPPRLSSPLPPPRMSLPLPPPRLPSPLPQPPTTPPPPPPQLPSPPHTLPLSPPPLPELSPLSPLHSSASAPLPPASGPTATSSSDTPPVRVEGLDRA